MKRSVTDLARWYFRDRTHYMGTPRNSALGGDDVAVEGDYQPEERDTNTAESVEITAVWHEDNGDKIDLLTDAELKEMGEDLLAKFHGYCEAYYEGDG